MYPIINIIHLNFTWTNFRRSNAPGSNNGTSWENAYTEIYTAIENSENGEELWVAQGKYKVSLNGEGFIILGRNLKIYGGFTGTETSLAQRNSNPLNTIIYTISSY